MIDRDFTHRAHMFKQLHALGPKDRLELLQQLKHGLDRDSGIVLVIILEGRGGVQSVQVMSE